MFELLSAENLPGTPASVNGATKTKGVPLPRRAEHILGFPLIDEIWNTTVEISPTKAEMILAAMPGQRPLNRKNLEHFRQAIKTGAFQTTHQGIAFNTQGVLIDGQHRLNAVVDTGMPIKVQVTFNLPDGSFAYLDRGRTRSLGDDLTIRSYTTGGADAFVLQASVRIIWNFEAGRAPWASSSAPLLTEAESIIGRHPHLLECVKYAITHRKVGLPSSAFGAFGALFCDVDKTKADRFMVQVGTGEGLHEGDPAFAFRKFLDRIPTGRTRKNRSLAMIALVRAWNAFYANRRLEAIKTALPGDVVFLPIAGLKS